MHTDVGVTGIGEVNICMGPNPEVIRAMTEQMSELLVGDTPLAPQRLVSRVLGAGWYPFHRTAGLVLGGLEMACWDAVGKHLGQPVSTFFGGALKRSFPSMYYIQAQTDLDAMVEQARDAVGRGFGTHRLSRSRSRRSATWISSDGCERRWARRPRSASTRTRAGVPAWWSGSCAG